MSLSPYNQASASHSGQKRPAWEGRPEQPSKRRAARACLSCRNRKVRCDVVNGGHPCTNCRLDAVDCVVIDSNRGRKPAQPPAPVEASSRQELHRRTSSAAGPAVQMEEQSPRQSRSVASENVLHASELNDTNEQQGPYETQSPAAVQGIQSPRSSHLASVNSPVPKHPHHIETASLQNACTAEPYLPAYIRPLPRRITARDLSYLADKGALTIPDQILRDEILRAYVTYVYPFMPTIDLEQFLDPIIRHDNRGSVSLILFQALMFAAVSFVDLKLLQSRGYRSAKVARRIFYGRVRLLYALECEQDHLPLLQAVLLMTYWYDCPEDGKDMRYWTGVALSLAQVIGMHRDTEPGRTPFKDRQLRRRIWWSCVMQDRLSALGIRRTSRIRDEEFDVPQLTLDDFDLGRPSQAVTAFLEAGNAECGFAVSDPAARVTLAVLCIELSKLAVCVGHILQSQYSAVSNQPMIAEFSLRIVVVPTRSQTSQQDVRKCDAELEAWLRGQDPRAKWDSASSRSSDGSVSRAIGLHQALLHMNYLFAVSILHNPQVFNPESATSEMSAQRKWSRGKVADAAVGLTKLAFDLQRSDQLRHLSTSSVPAFISATLTHLVHMRAQEEELRNISVGRFYQCMHVLQQLQSIYNAADYAVHFLEAILKNINITVPSLMPGVPSTRPDWGKPQLLQPGRREASPDSDTALRLATAYPSPSSNNNTSGNDMPYEHGHYGRPPADEALDVIDPDPGGASLHRNHMQDPAYGLMGGWPSATGGSDTGGCRIDNMGAVDFLSDAALTSNWLDIAGLVPPLMNVEGDNSNWVAAAAAAAITATNNTAAGDGQDLF